MRKSALGSNADADLLSCTLAEEAGRASRGRASRGRASRWPNNAAGRRQTSRREARAPAQGVPNAREENVREEAAEEVVAGAEGAQEGRDMMEELPQREEEAAEGAEAAQALRDVTQEIRKRDEEKVLDDEEQEAEEKGAGKEGQAGSAPPAGESVGGGAAGSQHRDASTAGDVIDRTDHAVGTVTGEVRDLDGAVVAHARDRTPTCQHPTVSAARCVLAARAPETTFLEH